ncbi:YdiU family protein [Roseateles sp. BYS180W]|uniref:Protein nucleotidyltransferase YdiU n=1 Tax=Roseateles rivi TaxID=3299028 RepID=A0ABW7FWX3_9BURK
MSAPIPFDNLLARTVAQAGVPWQAHAAPQPAWLFFNAPLAQQLGLDAALLGSEQGLQWWSGREPLPGAAPLAQAYAGHQFGGFSPQLGDGRALLLGDFVGPTGQRWDLALKGSGPTPFARRGDGKAALGPVLREALVSEAMAALGIPSTRVLAALRTGETIRRERPLPGAQLVRVAASHLRVGSFEYFAARQDHDVLAALLAHAIERHDADLRAITDPAEQALAWLQAVGQRQARLVAQWWAVGFIHGVMNTDNMAISGETLDYGPCAFMEAYAPDTHFSAIDSHGRYAYDQQPLIAQWNLARLAEALLPLITGPEDSAARRDWAVARATEVVQGFDAAFGQHWQALGAAKLGLAADADPALLTDFLALLQAAQADFTLSFWHLAALVDEPQHPHPLLGTQSGWQPWQQRWHQAWQAQGAAATQARLRASNPLYIPRNHLVEAALDQALEHGSLAAFERLLQRVRQPFGAASEAPELWRSATPAEQRGYQTFCGT